ncbi:MAG: signal peptidase I [Bryobacteraceae bacterium]
MNEPSDQNSAPEVAPTPSRTRSALLTTVAWFRDLMLSALIAVLVILFLYRPVKVEGTSMMPSLFDQERLFINQFTYKFGIGDIERGDTVVFWFPKDPTKSYIKRVIGVPGDTVLLSDGVVYVNGKRLNESYVPAEYRDFDTRPPVRIGSDEFFVMGDHRISSNDSRNWGLVPRSYIYGKAVFVFWPLEHIGTVR